MAGRLCRFDPELMAVENKTETWPEIDSSQRVGRDPPHTLARTHLELAIIPEAPLVSRVMHPSTGELPPNCERRGVRALSDP
jgi:hypothetical protein